MLDLNAALIVVLTIWTLTYPVIMLLGLGYILERYYKNLAIQLASLETRLVNCQERLAKRVFILSAAKPKKKEEPQDPILVHLNNNGKKDQTLQEKKKALTDIYDELNKTY